MTKIEAINLALAGDVDGIKHGTSVFIVDKDTIINKRSRKMLDMKHLTEKDWEGIVDPKWYDNLEESEGVLCWIRGGDVSIVKKINDDGIFENMFQDVLGDTSEVWPVKLDELSNIILGGIPHPKRKVKAVKTVEEEPQEVDDGVEIIEGNEEGSPNESSKSIVLPKEDAGESKTNEEEIPF